MSQPAPYNPLTEFLSYQAQQPWFPGQQLDAEFNNLSTSINEIETNLALIQRDDGALANGSVTYDALAPALQSAGLQPLSPWVTGTFYQPTQCVLFAGSLYQCQVANTSTVFSTDFAAGYWTLLANLSILSGTSLVNANTVAAGPRSAPSAVPTFRSLIVADLPTGIPNANLANASLTLGSTNIALGATVTSLTGLSTPVNPTDVAIKSYVDTVASGLSVRDSVAAATTTTLPTNTYSNGTAGVGATLTASSNGALTIDGYSVQLNDRLLIQNEATGANNGIYVCTTLGTSSVPYVLTRATDANSAANINPGIFTFCENGTTNGGSGFVLVTTGTITVGTTALSFTRFSGAVNTATANQLAYYSGTTSVSGNPDMTVSAGALTLGLAGSAAGSLVLANATSGSITLKPPTGALGSAVLTLPDVTDTLAGLSLANGGTNASLTASNGGIVYSGASAFAILAGTSTALKMLQSGATAAPSWSTATWPSDVTAAGQVLNSTAAHTWGATATPTLGVAGTTVGSLAFANATSGSVALQPATGALGSSVLTMPAATDTIALLAAAQTLTNKTISGGTLSGTIAGTPTLSGANFVTLANVAQIAGFSLLGNTTGSTANIAAFTIGGLTQKASPASTDLVLIQDQAASGALKYATVSSIGSAGSVSSIAGNTGAFTLTGGITNSTNAIKLALNNSTICATPTNPTGITSTTAPGVMLGMGGTCALTPTYSGRVHLTFDGNFESSSQTNYIFIAIRYGTGTAPSNGAAAAGTVVGAVMQVQTVNAANDGFWFPFAKTALITGLTPGTAYWFDIIAYSGGAQTATFGQITFTAFEF